MNVFSSALDAPVHTFACNAMATRFEIALPGGDEIRLRAAAEEAFAEVQRLEALLSPFRATSEIAAINARAGDEAVRVSPETFRLLEHAQRLFAETEGAFDLTVGPLLRAWGFFNGSGHLPDPEKLSAARSCTGMHLVELTRKNFSVRFARRGVQLDLGAIGKGYAVERAADLLANLGVESALIHGGTSTIFGMGRARFYSGWNVAIPQPTNRDTAAAPLECVELCDEALSLSAGWGKSFFANGIQFGHVLDPRLGKPVQGAQLAVVLCRSAMESDALSTALLVRGAEGIQIFSGSRPELRMLVVDAGGTAIASDNFPPLPSTDASAAKSSCGARRKHENCV